MVTFWYYVCMDKKVLRGLALKKEENDKAVKRIISFFQSERDEEIGVIAAQQLLDFFLEEVGAVIYNQGVDDVQAALKELVEGLDYNVSMLKKDTK